ncbi:Glutamine--fructose-6-phosphate aminotransferase [isomerizing] 2 [Saguinus oedipus]|uniref:glutamine--fructose-6-phosphate transaminase (isomerizing) n=1 Tax=Saguinus oedipus TaxID=9490 RepID=A0ABQ9W592_SAGOE|nr:Glutamine--fructose-6-phosphate aminotransferase [isomerizing] 2 [Saguinus oedipus]
MFRSCPGLHFQTPERVQEDGDVSLKFLTPGNPSWGEDKRIFAYMGYRVPQRRKEIFETIIKGLQQLEYRGCNSADFLKTVQLSNLPLTDSPGHAALTLQSTCARCVRQSLSPKITDNVYITGVAIDGNNHEVKERHIQLVKKRGKVKALDEELYQQDSMDLKVEFETHFGIAHTRCATHRVPSAVNSHPQCSDKGNGTWHAPPSPWFHFTLSCVRANFCQSRFHIHL